MIELVASEKQRKFGRDKRDTWPRSCRACDFVQICNGECPRNRFVAAPDGEPGLNYLCQGYKAFFKHADRPMRMMLLQQGRCADEIMRGAHAEGNTLESGSKPPGRNEPCFCGSGQKYKKCHGK